MVTIQFLKKITNRRLFILSNLIWFILFETFGSKRPRAKSVMNSVNLFRISIASSISFCDGGDMGSPGTCLILRTLLSKSLHDTSFLWPFLSGLPPTIEFKDFKTLEYYGIQIETFELTTAECRRMKKIDSETKIRITWWKIRPGDPTICSI